MISKEECLKIGGHCYGHTGGVIATNPPIYHRVCKHCGHIQEGHPRESIKWNDDIYQDTGIKCR